MNNSKLSISKMKCLKRKIKKYILNYFVKKDVVLYEFMNDPKPRKSVMCKQFIS